MSISFFSISNTLAGIGFIILIYVRLFAKEKFSKLTAIGGFLVAQTFIVAISQISSQAFENNTDLRDLRLLFRQDSIIVKVNDKTLDSVSTSKLLLGLRTLRSTPGHHSHPVDTTHLEIIAPNKTVKLTIGKDSEFQNEYWVYWFKNMDGSEIGRVYFNLDSIK